MKTLIGTIDITPTWSALLPIYMDALENPKSSVTARNAAREELTRMAALADEYVALAKKANEK